MARDTCKMPSCDREPGAQDREDYNSRVFCSVQCETKHDHIKADARDAYEREPDAYDAQFNGGL